MAIEVRYVGNVKLRPWTAYDLNELNIVENGFLDEFRLAQANLQANIAAGRGEQLPLLRTRYRHFALADHTSPTSAGSRPRRSKEAGVKLLLHRCSRADTFLNSLALNNPAPFTFVCPKSI